MFEHTFYTRKEDEKRTVFAFTPVSAPYKATVFPLLQRAELNAPAEKIAVMLRSAGLSTKIDTTSASPALCRKLTPPMIHASGPSDLGRCLGWSCLISSYLICV